LAALGDLFSDPFAVLDGFPLAGAARLRDRLGLPHSLGIVDHLRRRFLHFKPGAHFLDLRGLFLVSTCTQVSVEIFLRIL
jgi:hypothetical protein